MFSDPCTPERTRLNDSFVFQESSIVHSTFEHFVCTVQFVTSLNGFPT